MAKKKYLGEKVEATEFQGSSSSMVKDVLAMTLESKEEREKREAEQRKKILSLYKKDMTQAEAMAAIDELSDLVKYDDGLSFDHTVESWGKSVFPTKAEAEARLKELDNSYKENR